MEQPKSNENSLSTDLMDQLHNLTNGSPIDPEKEKRGLELAAKIMAEKDAEKSLALMRELKNLFDPNRKEEKEPASAEATAGKETLDKKDEALAPAPEQKRNPNASHELKENGTFTVGPLVGTFDAKQFFRDDNPKVKLSIFGGFEGNVCAMSEKVSGGMETQISSHDLPKPMNDTEIRAKLPENHVFGIDELWMIADIIEHKSAVLRSGSKYNLFYVQVDASVLGVDVYWRGSGWGVNAWVLDGYVQWNEGDRVFSRNG